MLIQINSNKNSLTSAGHVITETIKLNVIEPIEPFVNCILEMRTRAWNDWKLDLTQLVSRVRVKKLKVKRVQTESSSKVLISKLKYLKL